MQVTRELKKIQKNHKNLFNDNIVKKGKIDTLLTICEMI